MAKQVPDDNTPGVGIDRRVKEEIELAVSQMGSRKLWGVAEQEVLDSVGKPSEVNPESVVRLRRCPHMGACLQHAVIKRWEAMSCIDCSIYLEA